jgi:hypothetical protein
MSTLNLYGLFPSYPSYTDFEDNYEVTGNKLFGERIFHPIECHHLELDIDGKFQFIRGSEYGEFTGNNGVVLTSRIDELELKDLYDYKKTFIK